MKVRDLVVKIGGATKSKIIIREGLHVLCEVANRDNIIVKYLKMTVTFFNVIGDAIIIQVKENN